MTSTLTIVQGTTTSLYARNIRIGGVLIDPTGWTIHGVLRRDHVEGMIIATWRNVPGSGELLAEVAGPDLNEVPTADPTEKWVYLRVPYATSSGWAFSRGVVHAEVTEPGANGRRARIIDRPVYLDREAVI